MEYKDKNNKIVRKTCEYLYDIHPRVFINLLYLDALKEKIKAADILLSKLLAEHYTTRDTIRIQHVLNAINFNNKLIKEGNE